MTTPRAELVVRCLVTPKPARLLDGFGELRDLPALADSEHLIDTVEDRARERPPGWPTLAAPTIGAGLRP